jgi:hypothetical protein
MANAEISITAALIRPTLFTPDDDPLVGLATFIGASHQSYVLICLSIRAYRERKPIYRGVAAARGRAT